MNMASGSDSKIIKVSKNTQDKNKNSQLSLQQVRVEYKDTPPQVFISELNAFIAGRHLPRGFKVELAWERVLSPEEVQLEEQQQSNHN